MLKPYICEVDLLNAQGIVQKVESTATLLIACAKVVILFITLFRVIGILYTDEAISFSTRKRYLIEMVNSDFYSVDEQRGSFIKKVLAIVKNFRRFNWR